VDVETLSGISEHLLAYPPKDDCRNANPKKIQCPNYSGFRILLQLKHINIEREDIETNLHNLNLSNPPSKIPMKKKKSKKKSPN
jgi:hypothetical protein